MSRWTERGKKSTCLQGMDAILKVGNNLSTELLLSSAGSGGGLLAEGGMERN